MEEHPIALVTIIVTMVMFVVLFFIARRRDLVEEKEEHMITFVGSEDSFYHYEIRIKTGMYPYAGQYFVVFFNLMLQIVARNLVCHILFSRFYVSVFFFKPVKCR